MSPASASAFPSEKEARAPLLTSRIQQLGDEDDEDDDDVAASPFLLLLLLFPRATASAAALAEGFSLESPRCSLAA